MGTGAETKIQPDEAPLEPHEVGPRATIDAALVHALAGRFGLGDVRSWEDLGGTYNLNVRLRTGGNDYVLRLYRPWVTPARLRYVHLTRAALHAAGLPVPPPIPTLEGDTMLEVNGRLVSHDPVVHDWDSYRRAFRMLGVLHDALRAHAPTPPITPRVSNYGTDEQILRWLGDMERVLKLQGDETALQRCEEALSLAQEIAEKLLPVSRDLPVQPIHGDYRLGNVVFRGAAVAAILDFDFLAVRERLYEIAYAMYWLLVALGLDATADAGRWREVAALLDAYDRTTALPLTTSERRAFPYMLARVPLYWIAEAHLLPNPAEAVDRASPGLSLARDVIQNAPDIAALLLSQ